MCVLCIVYLIHDTTTFAVYRRVSACIGVYWRDVRSSTQTAHIQRLLIIFDCCRLLQTFRAGGMVLRRSEKSAYCQEKAAVDTYIDYCTYLGASRQLLGSRKS